MGRGTAHRHHSYRSEHEHLHVVRILALEQIDFRQHDHENCIVEKGDVDAAFRKIGPRGLKHFHDREPDQRIDTALAQPDFIRHIEQLSDERL